MAARTAPLSQRNAVERAVAAELSRHGANRVAIAGILGNAWRESLMKPKAEGTGGGGLWGFTAGAVSLANLKRAGGDHWGDPAFQTNFMLAHGGKDLIGKLNKAKSPEEAARIFMEEWERPGIPALEDREAGARYAFRTLGDVPVILGPGSRGREVPPPRFADVDTDGGLSGDLMHVGLVAALVVGGAGLIGLGITRVFGTAAKGRTA